MALPHDDKDNKAEVAFPNPLIFCAAEQYNVTQPEEASSNVLNLIDHDAFNFAHSTDKTQNQANNYTTQDQQKTFKEYLELINIPMWSTLSHTSKSAGEHAITNESEQRLMAFEGTMLEYGSNGQLWKHTHGSGHLGPSYVGVASIREGRGISMPAATPTLHRLV